MSKISYEQINSNDRNGSFKVGFFGLKNDGDKATVRILHDSTDSFDLVTTHQIELNGKYRRVNCIRTPKEPLNVCPFCQNGVKIQQRMYIHLLEYSKQDENGKFIPEAKTWERSASYAATIKNLIDEYGPLSDCVFNIRRSGAAGSMDTTYSIA